MEEIFRSLELASGEASEVLRTGRLVLPLLSLSLRLDPAADRQHHVPWIGLLDLRIRRL